MVELNPPSMKTLWGSVIQQILIGHLPWEHHHDQADLSLESRRSIKPLLEVYLKWLWFLFLFFWLDLVVCAQVSLCIQKTEAFSL